MSDLSQLSDEGLMNLYRAQKPSVAAMSDAELMAAYKQAQPKAPETTAGDAAWIAAGGGLDRAAAGLRQMTPEPVRNAIDWANDKLGMGQVPSIDKSTQDSNKAAIAGLREQHPIATLAGELPQMAAASTPAGMAGLAALEYGTPQERAQNAAGAFIGGKVGQGLGNLAGRVLQPVRGAGEDAVNATKALFDKYGISGLPGQITGSKPLQWMEQTLSNLPGGGRMRSVVDAQQRGLNEATMSKIGAAGDSVTPEAVDAAKAALGKTFNTLPKTTTVAVDDALLSDLGNVETKYSKNLAPDQKAIVGQYIDDILAHGNEIPGDSYQAWRSRISARANSTQDSELKQALTGIYKGLDRAFDRSATPEVSATMAATRQQYGNAKTIEKLANVSGDVSPARLASNVKNLRGDAKDLSGLGLNMKGLPDSGTAQRLFYQSLLSGGIGGATQLATGDPTEAAKYAAGSFAAPWLVSQALTRAPIKNYLTNGLLHVSPEIEKALQRIGAAPAGLLGQRLSQ